MVHIYRKRGGTTQNPENVCVMCVFLCVCLHICKVCVCVCVFLCVCVCATPGCYPSGPPGCGPDSPVPARSRGPARRAPPCRHGNP